MKTRKSEPEPTPRATVAPADTPTPDTTPPDTASPALKRYREHVAEITARGGSMGEVDAALRLALDTACREEALEAGARQAAYLRSFGPAPVDPATLHERLTAAVDEVHNKAKADRDRAQDRVEVERAKLAPVAAKAAAALRELTALQSEKGELIATLSMTDWFKLRGVVDPRSPRAEWLLQTITRISHDVQTHLSIARHGLQQIPGRIAKLTATELLATSVRPSAAERIVADVQSLAAAPSKIEDDLAVAVMYMQELDRFRLATSVPVQTITRSAPKNGFRNQAVTEYNVLQGAPNTARR